MNNQLIRSILAVCALSAAAFAQSVPGRGPLVIDLRNGQIHDLGTNPNPTRATNTYTMPYATVQVQANRSCPETPFMARVDMNLAPAGLPAASRVFVNVAYDSASTREQKLPVGWVTHIGDDSLNDGFGGGSGPVGTAEVQVLDQDLAVYSAALSAGTVDRIADQELRLAKGSLRFEIAN
ncbi:MAG: hypothetical protein FJW31_23665 [Acidobacteria bacterium]|nr:hypothetical protein [Acidobacteriota bacterium]